MSIQESIKIIPQTLNDRKIAVVEFDLVGEKVNKLSTPIMIRFQEVLRELQTSAYEVVIIKSNKQKIFIAGADIEEIKAMTTESQFNKAIEQGHEIMNQLEDLPMPTIAAIHGACAGGGCELVLACDYRIGTDDPSTRIGLPETKLGIIPGFGGCVRLPRVVGLQASLDIILAGKLLIPKKAEKIGLLDQVVHPSILMEQALKLAGELIAKNSGKRRKTFKAHGFMNSILEGVGKGIVFSQAKKALLKQTKGHYPAPAKALEVISKTDGMSDRAKALEIEKKGFAEVAATDVSKNLIHVFYLTEMIKKTSGVASGAKAHPVSHFGVLGAGTMGGGIAYVAADKGIFVRMKDLSFDALGKGLKHARDLWAKQLKKRRITEFDLSAKMAHISTTTDDSGFGLCDVVVEAVVEDLEIKKKVIAALAPQLKSTAIFATNTSSLSVSKMAEAHPHPENFAGMHFFNPVDKMPLVEVIRGEKTSDEAVATIYELIKRMGKTPVVCKDGPGFLVNRLLLPYMAEAACLLEEGMDIARVDKAYVYEFGMPMGPFALMDEVGLDVCLKVLKIFKKSLGDRVEIPAALTGLEKTGRLGRKNGKGFYKYSPEGRRGDVDDTVYNDLGLKSPTNPLDNKTCIERGIFAMINECGLMLLEDHIVEKPEEVDLGMIMGTGFPPFRGGLLRYADSLGITYIVDQLEMYSQRGAKRLTPTAPLLQMAKSNRKFYYA